MTDRVFNVAQPIVFKDGTMQYAFREFVREVDVAITNAALTSVWGSVGGDITTQDDLISGGKILSSLISEASVTQHEAALSIAWSQITSPQFVPPTVRNEATDPYTFVIGDANTVVRFTATDADVTVPVESSVNFPTGTLLTLRFAGTGTPTLTTTSLTINGTVPSLAQHVEFSLRKVGADTWDVI